MLLTEQEIALWLHIADEPINFARAIESAVLAKLKAQGDVGVVVDNGTRGTTTIRRNDDIGMIAYGTRLYEHPLPPDDVVQKYGELLYAVHKKFPDETRHQTALRYIKKAESPSYTNTAMGK